MEAEAVLVAAATLVAAAVSAALLAAALALRQPFTVAAFEQRRPSGGHTLRAEVSADQVPRLDSIMAGLEYQLSGPTGSQRWAIDQQLGLPVGPPRLRANKLARRC
jgi:hypothetical protein